MTPYADDYLRYLLAEVENGTARIESVELRSSEDGKISLTVIAVDVTQSTGENPQ